MKFEASQFDFYGLWIEGGEVAAPLSVFGGEVTSVNDAFEAASLQKLHIARLALDNLDSKDMLVLDRELDIPAEGRGSGILHYAPDGYTVLKDEAIHVMLAHSDNTAFKLLVRALGGPQVVNKLLEDSRLTGSALELPKSAKDEHRFYSGKTSVADLIETLAVLREDEAAVAALEGSIGGAIMRGYKNHEYSSLKQRVSTLGLKVAGGHLPERFAARLLEQAKVLPGGGIAVKKGNLVDPEQEVSYFHEAGLNEDDKITIVVSAMKTHDGREPKEQTQQLRSMYRSYKENR